jgi:hypothetical protein
MKSVDSLVPAGISISLAAENKRLREALEEIREVAKTSPAKAPWFYDRIARRALEGRD